MSKDQPRTPKQRLSTEYPIPGELSLIVEEADGAKDLRDVYAKQFFGFKKALKCSTIAVQKHKEFWTEVGKLYPELEPYLTTPGNLAYYSADKVVRFLK